MSYQIAHGRNKIKQQGLDKNTLVFLRKEKTHDELYKAT